MVTQEHVGQPWLQGRVPNGFWDDRRNRVRYMDWLAQRCAFQKPEDWYEVRKSQFKSNGGGGLLCTQYADSTHEALRDYRPRFRWLPWKFHSAPKRFWCAADNRRRYMDWLAVEIGIRHTEDWYGVTKQTFADNHGAGLLRCHYGDSVSAAVREYLPEYSWCAWLFIESPQRFWSNPVNRRAYMTWLGQQLRFECPEDWYKLTARDFHRHKGAGLLQGHYQNSTQKAVCEFLPQLPSTSWLFKSVPQSFWHDVENRMNYLKWLGGQLSFQSSSDWFRLSTADFRRNHGGGLLSWYAAGAIGKALAEVLRDCRGRNAVIWPMIQLIECSSSGRDAEALFRALAS